MDDVQIATVRKNSREHFRIALREYRGVQMVDLRVYALDGHGNPVPTPKGVSVRPELIDQLIAGLKVAGGKARALCPALPHQGAPRHWQDGK